MKEDAASNQGKNADKAGSAEGPVHDPGRRFPLYSSAGSYADASFLSDEEKALGLKLLWVKYENSSQTPDHYAVQVRNPSYIFQSDPELNHREMVDGEILHKLVYGIAYDRDTIDSIQSGKAGAQLDAPDQRRFKTAMLMLAKVIHELQVEWVLRLVGTGEQWSSISRQQLLLLNHPKSAVWDEEERLALEFTSATINRSMGDDLFARAKQMWGTKQLLRYAKWITFYVGYVMMTVIDVNDAERNGEVKL